MEGDRRRSHSAFRIPRSDFRFPVDPYGKPLFLAADWSLQENGDVDGIASNYANEILFTGHRRDPETGLYYAGARYYHPTLGRWLQRDPIGYADGMGLYEYAASEPVGFSDPWGYLRGQTALGEANRAEGVNGEVVYYTYDDEGNVFRLKTVTCAQWNEWVGQTKWTLDLDTRVTVDMAFASGAQVVMVPEEDPDPALRRALAMSAFAQKMLGPAGFTVGRSFISQYFTQDAKAATWAQESPTLWGFAYRVLVAAAALATFETIEDMIDDSGEEPPKGGHREGDLPATGEPGSTAATDKGEGKGTIREYGPDGKAKRDYDFGHDHGAGDPHAHDWDWTKPGKERGKGRPLKPGE